MEDEEEEYDEDEDLFVRPDNRPMAFIMSPTGLERQMVGTGYHGVHHVTHSTRETDGRVLGTMALIMSPTGPERQMVGYRV